jgi:hypothetical protein
MKDTLSPSAQGRRNVNVMRGGFTMTVELTLIMSVRAMRSATSPSDVQIRAFVIHLIGEIEDQRAEKEIAEPRHDRRHDEEGKNDKPLVRGFGHREAGGHGHQDKNRQEAEP